MENKDIQLFIQRNSSALTYPICPGDFEGPHNKCISLKIAFKEMENIFDHIHQEKLKPLTQIWQNSYYFSIIISMEKIGRRAFNKGMKNIDEGPETENDATENSLTTILNDLEGPLEDFSENFIDDILGSPSAFFDTAISGWSNFEDFFSR
ncbi:CFF_collapsed_G0032000.mRNA.1.CDS.1 [Saccharomyces cerevisiae]|nr:CFF_collapsed_G0032000.mRNA.1.CDS.1 [Saccharomyces cerevisiae]